MTLEKVKDYIGMMAQPSINYKEIDYNLFYVKPDSIGLYWNKLDFSEAIAHTPMTTEDLRKALETGNCDLFLAKDNQLNTYGGLVLRVFESFGGRVMEIVCAAGYGMNEWFNVLWSDVEVMANKCQCNRIIIIGRKGWARQMKSFNFEQKAVVLEKVLNG
jgi:hypothetical protein